MRPPPDLLGLAYSIAGLLFAYHSAQRSGTDTHWGYALTGITCLILGAKSWGLHPTRGAIGGKPGRPDPFD